MTHEEYMEQRRDWDNYERIGRILRENKNLIPMEQARLQLIVDDLKRKLAR